MPALSIRIALVLSAFGLAAASLPARAEPPRDLTPAERRQTPLGEREALRERLRQQREDRAARERIEREAAARAAQRRLEDTRREQLLQPRPEPGAPPDRAGAMMEAERLRRDRLDYDRALRAYEDAARQGRGPVTGAGP